MGVVLVHHREVVEDVLLRLHHAPQARVQDHRQLVAEGRIVGHAVRDVRGEDVAVPVAVLQALAAEGRPPRRRAEEKPPRLQVARRPREVPDPLEPEHRVEDVERDRGQAVVRVRGGGGDPRGERARLADPLLQDLPLDVLPVVHELVGVLGLVELALGRVDPELPEEPLHTERARLVRHDGHDPRPDRLVAEEGGQQPHEGHRGRDLPAPAPLDLAREEVEAGASSGEARSARAGRKPPRARRRSLRYRISGLSGGGR